MISNWRLSFSLISQWNTQVPIASQEHPIQAKPTVIPTQETNYVSSHIYVTIHSHEYMRELEFSLYVHAGWEHRNPTASWVPRSFCLSDIAFVVVLWIWIDSIFIENFSSSVTANSCAFSYVIFAYCMSEMFSDVIYSCGQNSIGVKI